VTDWRRVEQQLILDRYRPLDELGRGGFAAVTLAWDTKMQRRVAIKRLELPRDDATGNVLHDPPGLAEARTSAMLNHQSIVTVYDFETDSDEAFLIMEYVDGSNLEDLLDNVNGALTIDEAACVIESVAAALDFAHDNGVLHLDIKPANVLVARDGRVKVADFGMAELSTVTGHAASFGGTVGYMPLEQLEGMRVSEAADEWSFALLAYEILTGANPFDAEEVAEAIALLEIAELPRASSYEPSLTPAVDEVLLAGTGLRPDDRYPTVREFARALLPHLGDPVAGRKALGELVEAYAADDHEDEEPGLDTVGLWDRLSGHTGTIMVRALAAAESGWLAWVGLAPTNLEHIPLSAASALIALAAALAPSLGVGLGLVAFSVGLFARQLWLFGILFAAAAGAWWWFAARRHAGLAVLPLAAPVLGMAQVPFLMPLLAGFVLPPLPAAAAAAAGALLQLFASAASGDAGPYASVALEVLSDPTRIPRAGHAVQAALLSPAAWVAFLGWPVAAFLMSVLCRRATRAAAFAGAVFGGAALVGANTLAGMTARAVHSGTAPANWTSTEFVASLGGSLILMAAVIALGAPTRAEEEDLAGDAGHGHAGHEHDGHGH
jgi:eukaryotic-like serine/threonine-protein kinase